MFLKSKLNILELLYSLLALHVAPTNLLQLIGRTSELTIKSLKVQHLMGGLGFSFSSISVQGV